MAEIESVSKGASVVFSNYNYAFLYFNQKYVELCTGIAETMSLRVVRRNVSAFMFEFSYAIPQKSNWVKYKAELDSINKQVNDDTDFNEIVERDNLTLRQESVAYPSYYKHFIGYLQLLSRYVAELSATYLPRTNYQRTLLSFKNDSPFYEKMHEYKREVYEKVSNFNLFEFRVRFNAFITFFYAYNLFINEKYVDRVLQITSYILSIFTHKDTIDLLSKHPNYSKVDIQNIYTIEAKLHTGILFCNSLINASLSSYGVLPKLRKKVYDDRTLI